jgi:alpha-beta hydrolase superfamily lysophospholipase
LDATGGLPRMTTGTFTGVGGVELFFRMMKPLQAPKAVVIVVHGHGDHSGGMKNMTESLVENKYMVYAFDLRGHGKSEGKRGYIKSWDEFRGDLHEFRKLVSKKHPDLPLYIAGHSIGGLITLDYSLVFNEGLAGIIAISPAISYEATRLERLGITVMGRLMPDYSIDKKQLNKKKSDRYAKFYADGLRHNTITPGLGRCLIQTISRVLDQAQSIQLPFLLQFGLDDKITPPGKLGQFFNEVASSEKQLYEYPCMKHRPFDEEGREMFLEDLVSWLDRQVERQGAQGKKSFMIN